MLTRTELNKWIKEAMDETDAERVWSAAQFGAILVFTDKLKDKLQEEGLLDDR